MREATSLLIGLESSHEFEGEAEGGRGQERPNGPLCDPLFSNLIGLG